MKAGKLLVNVSAILMLLYGAASVLAILLSVFHLDSGRYALTEHLKMSLPWLTVAVLVLKCGLFLLTGAYGLLRVPAAHAPRTAYLLAALCFLASLADTVFSLLLGSGSGVSEVSTYALEFVMPIVFALGVRLSAPKAK